MKTWPKTIGFGATQISFTTLIHVWCQAVRSRFHSEHPGANGVALSNFFWDFSWIGIPGAVCLTVALVFLHLRKSDVFYHSAFYFGAWVLVVWFGLALVGMEVPFVPMIDPRGMHY